MGTFPESLSLENAKYLVAVANHPRFLFKRLRLDSAVQALATKTSGVDLVSWVNGNAIDPPQTVEHLATVYVFLVALALRPFEDVEKNLPNLQTPNVPWAEEIIGLIDSSAKPTSHLELEFPIEVVSGTDAMRESSSSATQVQTFSTPSADAPPKHPPPPPTRIHGGS